MRSRSPPGHITRVVLARSAAPALRTVRAATAPRHYFVVSGLLTRLVAERLADAAADIGLMPAYPTSLAAGQTVVYYGEFGSKQDAQALARRVRTAGYTAAIIGQ